MSLQAQWITMATMVGSGLILGVVLDAYRVLKERFRLRGWVVSLVDLLYWVAAASLVFHLLVWSNWGELRFYVFVAVLAGFWIYFSWFSDGVFRFLRWLLQGLERIGKAVIRVVTVLSGSPSPTCGPSSAGRACFCGAWRGGCSDWFWRPSFPPDGFFPPWERPPRRFPPLPPLDSRAEK